MIAEFMLLIFIIVLLLSFCIELTVELRCRFCYRIISYKGHPLMTLFFCFHEGLKRCECRK